MFECKFCKSDKMQDLVRDKNGVFYCRCCDKYVSLEDIHPEILAKYHL